MEEKILTEKESFELISQMIQNTRDKIKKNSGTPFLIWGYVTIIVALATWYMLTTTGNHWWHLLWFSIPVLGAPLYFMFFKKKKEHVTTYIDRIVGNIWLVFGFVVVIASILSFIVWPFPILFLVLLLISMGVTLTGFVIRFNTAIGFGFFGIIASFAFLFVTGINQILVFAAIFLIMMVIPGHILNYLTKKELCSKN